MLYSMTGYGKAEAHYGNKIIHAEIKALNSKNLDLSVRMSSAYREHEMAVRSLLQTKLIRGKVEVNIWVEQEAGASALQFNTDVVAAYVAQIKEISCAQGIEMPGESLWSILTRLPETLVQPLTVQTDEQEVALLMKVVGQAVDALCSFRQQEGASLERMFRQKIDNIEALMREIEPYERGRVERIKERLTERLSELEGVSYDGNRLEQELIYYIEKLDISEEKQRLTNHLAYFRETLDQPIGQGKKLGFIAQEMGREINTTGSKSNQAEMQNIVVKMKDELEQIKEQVLNVL